MRIIGLHLSGSKLRLAIAKKSSYSRKLPSIEFETLPLSVKPLYISSKESYVLSAIDTGKIFFKEIPYKFKQKRHFYATLPLSIEELFSCPEKDLLINTAIYKKEQLARLVAVSKNYLNEHIELLQAKISIHPDQISAEPIALLRYLNHFFSKVENAILIHFDAETSSYIATKNRRLLLAQTLNFCVNDLHIALQKDHPDMDEEQRRDLIKTLTLDACPIADLPNFCQAVTVFKRELQRNIAYLIQQQLSNNMVILCGDILPFSLDVFAKSLFAPHFLHLAPIEDHNTYALAAGLCLNGLYNNNESALFYQKLSPKQESRAKRSWVFVCLFSMAIASLSWIMAYGSIYLSEKNASSLQKGKESVLAGQAEGAAPVSKLITWLSSEPLFQKISIQRVAYQLETGKKLSGAKIEIEYICESDKEAKAFFETLKGQNNLNQLSLIKQNSPYCIRFYLLL